MNCFAYDELFILNPGIPENRDYICEVAKDIVSRYDVDGIHMDDYFYPYPVKGLSIPDDELFQDNSNGIKDQRDWRRYNVNLFIEQFYKTVHETKPWVKVGISPFGIYRNKRIHRLAVIQTALRTMMICMQMSCYGSTTAGLTIVFPRFIGR